MRRRPLLMWKIEFVVAVAFCGLPEVGERAEFAYYPAPLMQSITILFAQTCHSGKKEEFAIANLTCLASLGPLSACQLHELKFIAPYNSANLIFAFCLTRLKRHWLTWHSWQLGLQKWHLKNLLASGLLLIERQMIPGLRPGSNDKRNEK